MNLIGRKSFLCPNFCLLFVLLAPMIAAAEQLPVRTYTAADGLSHDRVQRIIRDSRGFLWF